MDGRLLIFTFAFSLWVAGASADSLSDPLPRYERAGNGFGCHMDKADFEKGEAEKRDVCLQIGPLFVGMPRAKAEALLGKPAATVPVGNRQAFAYSLQEDNTGLMTTYAVLTYSEDGKADTVQITGLPWNGSWQFCGLTLGSNEASVGARLGAPLSTRKSKDQGAMQWDYAPWTFSFEVKAGVISSIRLAQ